MLRLIIFVLIAYTTMGSAWGATTWYTIEVIAFSHLNNDGLYEENWPSSPGEPAIHNAVRLAPPGELALDDRAEHSGSVHTYNLLGRSSLRMENIANRLKQSSGYRPLMHIAWRQPGLSKSLSKAVYVHSALPNSHRSDATAHDGPAGEPQIQGTIRVSRARYLHVDTDLLHSRQVPADADLSTSRFRMRQTRRMRSEEVHYIDHPLFGVIVLITPHEAVEMFSEEQSESSEE